MDPRLLKRIEKALPSMPPAVQQKVGGLVAEARKVKTKESVSKDFMSFVKYVWPNFIHGRHHEKMAASSVSKRIKPPFLNRMIA